MSKTVNKCWLKDKDGTLIAPKTLSSQVINNDGKSLDKILQENEQRINEKIDTEIFDREFAIDGIDTRLKTIEKSVGEGGSVDEKIEAAIQVETNARIEAINDVQKNVDTLTQTHAADKKALEDSITIKVDQELKNETDRAKTEEARIENLLTEEADKAREEEGKLDTRLVKVETFFKTATNETLDTALDTLVEIQKYVKTEGSAADQMVLDIAENKKSIDAVDTRVRTAENKLVNIEENADVNVIETVKVNGVPLTQDINKAVDIIVPTGTLASKDKINETDLEDNLVETFNRLEELNVIERAVGINTSNISLNSDAIDAERKRIDKLISLPSGSTTGDAELIDGRIGVDGTEYESIGTAIRMQITDIKEEHSSIPNAAMLSGNYIKFYKTDGEVYSFLFEINISTLLESGLSLENLTLSTERINNSTVLTMSDGSNEKSIEIPTPVDESLLLTSNNPVQNRIVTEKFNSIIEEIENIKEYGIGGGGTGVTIRLTNQNGTSTLVGSYGNAINLMFTFTSTDNDLPTGNGNLKITINGVNKVNMSIPQGLTSIDVSPHLNIGSNTVIVTCTDVYGKSRNLSYDITVVKLSIESTFNASVPYENDILFKYTPYGSVEKTIHFVVDGTEIGNVVTSLSGKQMTRTIPKMSHGSHKLEIYSTATLNETDLVSPVLTYDIICIESSDTTPIIASVYTEENLSQGEQVSIPFIVYDPTRLSCDITLTVYTMEAGSEIVYSEQNITVDRNMQYWNTRKYPIGTVYFRIKYGQITKVHSVEIVKSKLNIEAESNDLELWLSSEGRSNNETNPNQWTYGDVTTTFNNMNWNSVGWISDENGDSCLRLNGDATAEISFMPFKDDLRVYGKTIELDFVIRDVNNRNAIPISCMSGDIGFEVKADTAYLNSEQSNVFCNYKEEERVRVSFVIQSKDEYRILAIYLNGVMSDAIQYPTTDNFQQTNPVNISIGSPYCSIDIYNIRSYSTALTDSGITTNFIADMTDIIRKTETYENNDIYDDFGEISFDDARKKNSVMVLIGDLPTYKGDKKILAVRYYDVEDSNLDFYESIVNADVQGTSSQFFVRKNWKLKFQNYHHIDVDQLPTNVMCIKVDYAEATGTHNTQNAVFVEKLYSEKVPAQESNPKVRTTIYGKPILLFHQEYEGADPVFYGKANMNLEKASEDCFGFTSDYDVECWEFKNNTSDACNFWGEIPDNWDEDFEARYPDKYKNISRFKLMHDWVVSTNQNKATGNALSSTYTDVDGKTYTIDTKEYRLAKFKTEFEDWFDMHYALIYYVYTFFALMVDQRAKNMFLTYWGNTGKYYFYFYD